jgi:hypothetical protein
MKTYSVTMPITGVIHVEVQAESEEIALEAFWAEIDTMSGEDINNSLEWEYCPHVTTGNVTHAMQNDVEIEEI